MLTLLTIASLTLSDARGSGFDYRRLIRAWAGLLLPLTAGILEHPSPFVKFRFGGLTRDPETGLCSPSWGSTFNDVIGPRDAER